MTIVQVSSNVAPQSRLTRERPDLWLRGLALAVGLTGCTYVPKVALPDGTIYACGGGGTYTPEEIERADRDNVRYWRKLLKEMNDRRDRGIKNHPDDWGREHLEERIREFEKEYPTPPVPDLDLPVRAPRIRIDIGPQQDVPPTEAPAPVAEEEVEEPAEPVKRRTLDLAPVVAVPEGAMEWMLHEVGHFVASTPEERARPNYGVSASELGHDGDREWQAWAFEEIVLAPFGPARHFAPPTQRDGAAFAKAGPMPDVHLRHAEREMRRLGVDVEQWRAVYGEWVRWGCSHRLAPWESIA